MRTKNLTKIILILILVGGIVFGLKNYFRTNNQGNEPKSETEATVFYSPTCSCCLEYIPYLKRQGFKVKTAPTNDMLSIKEKYQIPQEIETCHTTIIGDYFVEGHMPIKAIKKLLEEKPDILGIALPGMPEGSPGMGGFKIGEFKIYGILKQGTVSDFMDI